MDILPGVPLPLALALLALLDGLSIGTLLIPLFFLLVPGRVRSGRMLLYLATIAVFYLLVGVLFLAGLVNVIDVAGDFLTSSAGQILRLVVGGVLLGGALLVPTSARKREPATAVAGDASTPPATSEHTPSSRLTRWRERVLSDGTPPAAIMGIAVAAGVVEVATMVPYLVGMSMLADAAVPFAVQIAALGGYCAIMIAPALVLLLLRLVAAKVVDAPLRRLAAWLHRTAAENTAWIVGIIGFLVARAAATELGLFDALSALGG